MSLHEELKANAAGYVLGGLDAHDRREFEAHLAGCAECAAEVASLQPVVSVLATAVPQVTPRAEVVLELQKVLASRLKVFTPPGPAPETAAPTCRQSGD